MMLDPTLGYMVADVELRERHALAAAARRVPRSRFGLLGRLTATLRGWGQPERVPTITVGAPRTAIRPAIEAGS